MNTPTRRQAFSLLELVIVVAIVGVLAAMAIPRFANAGVRQRADAAARRMVADLNLARRRAFQTSSSQRVIFDVFNNAYAFVGYRDPVHPRRSYVVELDEQPYGVAIESVSFYSGSQVTFDAYGVPDSGGTIVLTVGLERRVITLDAQTGEASW